MSASTYLQFLQSPSTGALTNDASLHYITTTTAIQEPMAILKHLGTQGKQVVKKDEKVLSTIDGENAACIETVTTLQFRSGGGAYLPGIDGNLLDEKEVVFPLTHVVDFAADGKIRQIRLYWDQGTLLKQVEAIGKSGRNWPIRDGKAQGDAVAASIKATGQGTSTNGSSDARKTAELPIREPAKKRDSVSVTRDPHASLSLFAPRDPNEDASSTYEGPQHAVRASARPAPRDMGELFVGDETPPAAALGLRSPSPTKSEGVVLKSGAGKNFSGNRLFAEDENDPDLLRSPERKKTYDQKYEHFAFGEGEDAPAQIRPAGRKQGQGHQASFSFEDFVTPPKVSEKGRPDYDRHWGPGVDADDPESPPKRPVVHSARPDQNPHFELVDESPAPTQEQKASTLQRQRGQGLYRDPIADDARVGAKRSGLGVNSDRRGNDFAAQYTMADASPAAAQSDPVKINKRGTRSDLESHWTFESPTATSKKIYKTAGDGMGSRSGGRAWGIGDESDPEVEAEVRPSARGRRPQPPDVEF